MGNTKEKAPKTYSLRVTENGLQDIDDITGYIAYINHQPFFKEIPTKTKIYRKAVCMSWNIIYKIKNFDIVILGIIHSSRKASKVRSVKKVK